MTPGPLILVGGAEFTPGNEPQDELFAKAAAGRTAFAVPTAAARHRPDLAYIHAREWFSRFGLQLENLNVLLKTDASSPNLAELAAGGSGFYLVGGDPGLTVDVLRGSRVWEAIATAWRGGAVLAGSSAGAMALCEWSLIHARTKGDPNRRFKDALGLVPGTVVAPHFDGFGSSWVESVKQTARDVTVLGLDERTAAVHDGEVWRALGPGRVTVIDGQSTATFAAGDAIEGLADPV